MVRIGGFAIIADRAGMSWSMAAVGCPFRVPTAKLAKLGRIGTMDLKKGDRVVVQVTGRPAFNGEITGEGRSGHWWMVRKDGTKTPNGYHKDFCFPERHTQQKQDR